MRPMIKLKLLWTSIIPYSASSIDFFHLFFLVKPTNVFGSQRFTFRDQVSGVNVPASSLASENVLTVSLDFCLESTKSRLGGGGFFCCCFCSLTKHLMYAPMNPGDSPVACSRGEYLTLWTLFSDTDMHDYSGLPEAGRFTTAKRSASFKPEELPCLFTEKEGVKYLQEQPSTFRQTYVPYMRKTSFFSWTQSNLQVLVISLATQTCLKQ